MGGVTEERQEMAQDHKITVTVVVSGARLSVTQNGNQKVEHLIQKALEEAGIPHPQVADWTLRFADGGAAIDPDLRIDAAGIATGAILFLDPDEGGGGEAVVTLTLPESPQPPVLVDPAISAVKLDRQLADWEANADVYRERGWQLRCRSVAGRYDTTQRYQHRNERAEHAADRRLHQHSGRCDRGGDIGKPDHYRRRGGPDQQRHQSRAVRQWPDHRAGWPARRVQRVRHHVGWRRRLRAEQHRQRHHRIHRDHRDERRCRGGRWHQPDVGWHAYREQPVL